MLRWHLPVLVLLLGAIGVVSSQTSGLLLFFQRDSPNQNGITLTCRDASSGSTINNAIFQSNGAKLNTVAAPQYEFVITQQLEANFTCYEYGEPTIISPAVQLAELPTVYNGVNPKTLYVHRGDVAELPCDYQPGLAMSLYSGKWIRGLGTTVNPSNDPYQGLSQTNYSLFLLANETANSLDEVTHQCSVQVQSCSGDCSTPTPLTFFGAMISVNIIEPPDVNIVTPGSLVIPVDQAVDLTCAPVGEHIASVHWNVDGTPCSQDPSCSIKLEKPNSTTISVIATSTVAERVVECKVIQTLTSEEVDIVNPEDPQQLVDKVEFQFSSTVTITVENSPTESNPIIPTSSSTVNPTGETTKPPTGDGGEILEKHLSAVIIATVIVLAISIVMCSFVIIFCKKYNRKRPDPNYDPDHICYPPYPDHIYDEPYLYGEKSHDMTEMPFYNVSQLSGSIRGPVYGGSQGSGTSESTYIGNISLLTPPPSPYRNPQPPPSGGESYPDGKRFSRRRYRSASPRRGRYSSRSRSRSPVYILPFHHRRVTRSLSPNCRRPNRSNSPATDVVDAPPPVPPYMHRGRPETGPARISEATLLAILTTLAHGDDCSLQNCPCRDLKAKIVKLRSRMPHGATVEPIQTGRPTAMGMGMGRTRWLGRQRSRSCDLTPIMEQPSPLSSRNSPVANRVPDLQVNPTFAQRPCFLREISVSEGNLPYLYVNGDPITPSPLRENRGLAISPQRGGSKNWMAHRVLESLPEQRQYSMGSTTSDESNTSSRNDCDDVAEEDSDPELTLSDVVEHPTQGCVPKRTPLPPPQESGYDSQGSEGSRSDLSGRRRNLAKVHEMHCFDVQGDSVAIQVTDM